jgi:hypothetical protein
MEIFEASCLTAQEARYPGGEKKAVSTEGLEANPMDENGDVSRHRSGSAGNQAEQCKLRRAG